MFSLRSTSLLLCLLFVSLALGCSGSSESPVIPPGDEPLQLPAELQEREATGPVSWGVWDCTIDAESEEVVITPMRSADFTANVTMYLQPPAGTLANMQMTITDITNYMTQGKITVDIQVTHPFPSNPEYTGFDVMGVFMHNGSLKSAVGYNNFWPQYPSDAILLNHDGYTRWMNMTEFTTPGLLGFVSGALGNAVTFKATINPYKYFADGLSKTQTVPSFYSIAANIAKRGKFGAGMSNTREYQLQFPMFGGSPLATFQYAVIARWDTPIPSPPTSIPGSFPATANCQEAFYIEVRDAGSTLNYHPISGGSGDLKVDIEIWDWQGASNPLGFDNELMGLFVEGCNTWVQPPVNFCNVQGMTTESTGTCSNSHIYHVYLANCGPTQAGFENLMVNVQSNNPSTYNSGFPGFKYPPSAQLSGYTVAQIPVSNIANSTPSVPVPTGPPYVWENVSVTFTCAASDADAGDTLTYMWSVVPSGSPASYTIPGDLPPGTNTLTINLGTFTGYPPGSYDISCQVKDSSGAPNDTGTSPWPLVEMVYIQPYVAGPTPGQTDQIITQAMPSLQGAWCCPLFHDGFYGPIGMVTLTHQDISILSGPSVGMAGIMSIADEFGPLTGLGTPPMRFAHFLNPYITGNAPSWIWWCPGVWPGGPDIIPSVVHYDANINSEFFISNGWNPGPGKLSGFGLPEPSAFSMYISGTPATFVSDLYTSLFNTLSYDIAADATNGFDEGSVASPDNPPMYAMFTQDVAGILGSCMGPFPGPLDPNPVNFLMFPSGGVQPVNVPVDTGGPGIVAPLSQSLVSTLTGSGGGLFMIGPGGPCPAGNLAFPEPYYAMGVDDDPTDNPWPSVIGSPVNQVLVAAIDGDRDLEIYEVDFGVATPAPVAQWSSLTMGNFMGANPMAYPLDCEFISNFTGFGGTPKHVSSVDLLAVLLTDQAGGALHVEIFEPTPGTPTSIALTGPLPLPPMVYGKHGVGYRLDVDELNGDIYVVHESAGAPGGLGVTIFSY